jgi:hypothetical protein
MLTLVATLVAGAPSRSLPSARPRSTIITQWTFHQLRPARRSVDRAAGQRIRQVDRLVAIVSGFFIRETKLTFRL